jgi:hypothetical protein
MKVLFRAHPARLQAEPKAGRPTGARPPRAWLTGIEMERPVVPLQGALKLAS